jgi:hypothetical protein
MDLFDVLVNKYFEKTNTSIQKPLHFLPTFYEIWNIIISDELYYKNLYRYDAKYNKTSFYKWLKNNIICRCNKNNKVALNLIQKNDINS